MMSHWPLSFWVKIHHFTSWIDSVVCFVMYKFVLWMSILTYFSVWFFVMYMFVRMTIHILMGFRHVHVCTNDYSYYSYGFSSCTSLYEWQSISLCMDFCHAHFCTNDYPFLLNGFSSCTCLYEWLSISLCMDFCHARFCLNDYPFLLNGFSSCMFLYELLSLSFEWFFVMCISVRMTTPLFSMGFLHVHVSARMTTIYFWTDCHHEHFCTNDYHFFLNGLSSYTFLYEWLPFLFEWIFVMHIFVRMTTISFWMDFRHAHFCTNDYHFVVYGFLSCTFCANDFPYSFYIDSRHAIFCTIDFPYSFGFSMCAMLFNPWIAWCSEQL